MDFGIQHVVIGIGLVAFSAMMLGVIVWKAFSSQFKVMSKGSFVVLLIASGIATVEAQKTQRHVDANAAAGGDGSVERPFNDIQAALDYDYSAVTGRIQLVLEPGVYRPFSVDLSRRDALGGLIRYEFLASTNAGERVVDGGGVTNLVEVTGFSPDSSLMIFDGMVFRNGIDGVSRANLFMCAVVDCTGTAVSDSKVSSTVIERCRVGVARSVVSRSTVANCYGTAAVDTSELSLCWVTNNAGCGAVDSRLINCLVARNGVGCGGSLTRLESSTIAFNREVGVLGTVSAVNTLICNNGGYGDAEANWVPNEASVLTNCCVKPLPDSSLTNSIDNVLALNAIIPSTYKPRYGSAVLGAGNAAYGVTDQDLAGEKRLRNGALDIGAFRYGATLPPRYTTTSPVGVPFDWLLSIVSRYYNELPVDDPGGWYLVSEMPRDWVLTPCMHIQYQYPSAGGGAPWTFINCGYITFESLANSTTGKIGPDGHEFTYWEEFLYGTDPFDDDDIFTASISVEDGKMKISWSPDLRPDRVYYLLGKPSLSSERWECVDDECSTPCRFFKVGVDLP